MSLLTLIAISVLLFAFCALVIAWMAGFLTKATTSDFDKLDELARPNEKAKQMVRNLRAEPSVTLRDIDICAQEIKNMYEMNRAASALAWLD